jgi:hypothetical protein
VKRHGFLPRSISWSPQSAQPSEVLLGASVFIFILWLGSILLLALNTTIIRFKEGYGKCNPARLIAFLEHRRFHRIVDRIQELDLANDLAESLSERDAASDDEQDDLMKYAVVRFPHKEEFVLPTAFGNTIRAFEVYSFALYGLDAIPAWPRLLMVMPESSRALVESEKSQMDFWLNTWFLSLLFVIQYLVFALVTRKWWSLWPLAAIPIAWASSLRARSAAANWGELVKASFDVYLPKLREALDIETVASRDAERKQWEQMSQAMVFRIPEVLPARSPKIAPSSTTETEPKMKEAPNE